MSVMIIKTNTEEQVPQGLIGKTGENPGRSRHCNAEQIRQCHWETGKTGGAMKRSQENCLFGITV